MTRSSLRGTRPPSPTQPQSAGAQAAGPSSSSIPEAKSPSLGYYFKKGHPGSPTKHLGANEKQLEEADLLMDEIKAASATTRYIRRPLELGGEGPHPWWFLKHQVPSAKEEVHLLLPSMRECVVQGSGSFKSCLFDPSLSIYQNVCCIFKALQEIMLPSALHPHQPPNHHGGGPLPDEEGFKAVWPWTHPLVKEQDVPASARVRRHTRVEDVCMLASSRGRKHHSNHTFMLGGYVYVVLGSLRRSNQHTKNKHTTNTTTRVIERAHRVVYWAMLGPIDVRPGDWGGPEGVGPIVMHTCHCKACLSPGHLVLGNYSENNMQRGRADDYPEALLRREARGKACMQEEQPQ